MDYTNSAQRIVHPATGKRMHTDTGALPTEVSAQDINQINWAMMEVILDAGLTPSTFNTEVPATYNQLALAIQRLAATAADDPLITHALSVSGSTLTSTINGVAASVALPSGGGGGATTNTLVATGTTLVSTVNGEVATTQLPVSTAVGLGVGQTWADYSASRLANVVYTNTTGKPIVVNIPDAVSIDGLVVAQYVLRLNGNFFIRALNAIVPVGQTYELTIGGQPSVFGWTELR